MKNKLLLAFVAFALTAALAACGLTTTTAAPATTTTAATTQQPTTTTQPTTATTTTTVAPATLDLVGGFVAGSDNVYATTVADGVLTVQYDKHGFAWPTLVYAVEEDLSVFNKLVVTAKGDGVLLVRFVTPTEALDIRFELTGVDATRQIDLREVDNLADVTAIVLIAEPGMTVGRGEIVISDMVFEEGTAFGTVVELGLSQYDATYDAWIQGAENAYTFTTQLDGTIKVDYTKLADQAYLWTKSTFAAEAAGYNTMTVTLKGTAGNVVLVKPNDMGALETKMTFVDENPMSLTFHAENFTNLVLFAQPGDNAASTGTFYVVSVVLSYTESAVSRFEVLDFNNVNWVYDQTKYRLAMNEGVLEIDYYREVNENGWTPLKYFFPEFPANHNTVKLVVQGPEGLQLLLKPNDYWATEQWVTLTGEPQEVVFTTAAPFAFYLFIDPNATNIMGQLNILEATTYYTPSGTEATTEFAENDPFTYYLAEGPDGWTRVFYYKAPGQEWIFMRNTFDQAEVGDNNTMLVVLRGIPGKQVLLKPNDNGAMERWITFTDDQPVFFWVNSDVLTNLLVFAEGGTAPAAGGFEILGIYFSYTEPDAVPRDQDVDFTFGWVDNGGDMYSFATVDDKNVVTYNKVDGPWNNIKYTFTDNLANHNTLTFVVKGTAGKSITIKPNDVQAYERTITFDGTEQTVVFTLPVAPTHVILFAELAVGTAAGSFEIISATASWEPQPLDMNSGWAEGEPDTYAFVYNEDGSVTVNYTKTAAQSWTYMISNYDPELVAGYNTITLVIQGTAGKQAYLKPNDNGAIEQNLIFDGTVQTFEWTVAGGFSKFVILAEGGTADADGTFTIVSVTLTYVPGE